VRDIVFQKKKTSYKEVAEALIEEYHQIEGNSALGVFSLLSVAYKLFLRARRNKILKGGFMTP
jgi:hypothetical protein